MMTNQTEWDGEGLPPVGTMVQVGNNGNKYKVIGYSTIGSVVCESMIFHEYKGFHARDLKPASPKPKKIDMSKFAGSEIILRRVSDYDDIKFPYDMDVTKGIYIEDYFPAYNKWNHWTGDSRPVWLDGFEYEVKEWWVAANQYITAKDENKIIWSKVCAIKITGIKEGWEL